MAANRITASLVVNFQADTGAATSGGLVLEIDDRSTEEGGLNAGKTSFRPGDPAVYLLYQADNVKLLQHLVTAGGTSGVGGGNRNVTEYLTFSGSREASLRYPSAGGVSMSWLGRVGGAATMADQQTVQLPADGVGILQVRYQASYQAFRLSGVPQSISQVMIFVQGEVTT